MQRQHIDVRFRGSDIGIVQFFPPGSTAPLGRVTPPRLLDKNAPHRFGGGCEEMAAAIPLLSDFTGD